MSRIGKKPIMIPGGVGVTMRDGELTAKGNRGELSQTIPADVTVSVQEDRVVCESSAETKKQRALWGLYRVLIQNMITGVSSGFSKRLEIVGTGYRAEMKGKQVTISIGYSHPVVFTPPAGIELKTEGLNRIIVEGIDKQQVGQVAADIRAIRPPEPYKGKGIRYQDERVRRKAGKASGK